MTRAEGLMLFVLLCVPVIGSWVLWRLLRR